MFKKVGAFDEAPEEEFLKRMGVLKGLMAEAGFDYALLLENVDRFYFTGTMQKGMVVVPVDGDPLVFVEKGMERAKRETALPLIPVRRDKEIGQILSDRGILKGKAGLELDVLPVSLFERLKKGIAFDRYGDIAPLVKEVRIVKSPWELEQMKKSGRTLTHVFGKARDVVREGVTEVEIEATLLAEGRRVGHHGYLRMRGFNQEIMTMAVQSGYTGAIATIVDGPIAGAGVTPAVPQGSSFKRVERGIPVTIDYCGGYNGYHTDETRTFVAGELDEAFRKPYDTAREIIEDAMSFGREGVDCTEIFSRAYDMAKKAHLEDHFMGHGEGQVSFIGHGVGLEINELPIITPRHGRLLKEGMVFAFEPKFVLPHRGAIGIEVDFIVRPRGLERITADSLEIIRV